MDTEVARSETPPFVITVASGKGGVGKTTIALLLARMLSEAGLSCAYLDCDVEAPNGHLFLNPQIEDKQDVTRLIPVVNPERCTGCGACERVCELGAIVSLPGGVKVFPNLCISCGACVTVCRRGALDEHRHYVGGVEMGKAGDLRVVQGLLRVGEARNIPVIEAVRDSDVGGVDVVVRDAPPGTACPAVTSMEGSDLVILVTDATPFGLHDLSLIVDTVEALKLSAWVVINRSDLGDGRVTVYCADKGLNVGAQIPHSSSARHAYSNGDLEGIRREFTPHLGPLVAELTKAIRLKEEV